MARVGREAALRGPVRVVVAAARVDDRRTVGRELHGRELFAVVLVVRRDATRAPVGRRRDPEVAMAFLVECVHDGRTARGGGELAGERVAQHLRERERSLGPCGGGERGAERGAEHERVQRGEAARVRHVCNRSDRGGASSARADSRITHYR